MINPNPSSSYFEQIANQWNSLQAGYFTEGVRYAAIGKAYLRAEMVVADVGCGTGFMTTGLAPLVQQVHLLDGSSAMLQEARKKLAGFGNLIFHQTDGANLPLPDSSVDVAFANMYLHHCPDPSAAIKEMVRILKPAGRLVITDMESHDHTWMKEDMSDVWLGFTHTQLKSWYREADLVNVMIQTTGQTCCAESSENSSREEKTEIGILIASGTRRMAMREAVQGAYGAWAELGGSCCGSNSDNATLKKATCCGGSSEVVEESSKPSGSSCCQNDSYLPAEGVTFSTDYDSAERSSVPQEAEEISLGCGNPTALANLKPGEVVLDIGSGGGMDSFLAASRVRLGGHVIGVDMTPAMVTRAKATAEKSGIGNVEFRLGQAESLPVDDNSIDVILSNCVINLCEDKGLVFQEAFRVLKPGGRLEVSDMVTDKAFSADSQSNSGEWTGCVSGALPEVEYLDLIKQAGFTRIRSRRSSSAGLVEDVHVYSTTVSGVKPGGRTNLETRSSCGCGTGCCN